MTEKTVTFQRMAAIFNEWARRFADDPDCYTSVLDDDGKPFEDYGECCAAYFNKIASEMDADNLLPRPENGGVIWQQ